MNPSNLFSSIQVIGQRDAQQGSPTLSCETATRPSHDTGPVGGAFHDPTRDMGDCHLAHWLRGFLCLFFSITSDNQCRITVLSIDVAYLQLNLF